MNFRNLITFFFVSIHPIPLGRVKETLLPNHIFVRKTNVTCAPVKAIR